MRRADPAQRRPGFEPRRHPLPSSASPRPLPTLNEGRGSNLGDTYLEQPVHVPLRHRSTKAGVRTSATRALVIRDIAEDPVRSTKAGVRTSATQTLLNNIGTGDRSLNEGRGSNLGDTASRDDGVGRQATALNEGRGSNLGDTPGRRRRPRPVRRRSTKAGVRTSATLAVVDHDPVAFVRSTKAGVRTSATRLRSRVTMVRSGAQRRPGFEPRRHQPRPVSDVAALARSTKAGVRTSATLDGLRARSCRHAPLNEGRGSNLGDTLGRSPTAQVAVPAQRRPGFEPRRHSFGAYTFANASPAQRRPGFEPRRHSMECSSPRCPQS